jgi:hypothetical protein
MRIMLLGTLFSHWQGKEQGSGFILEEFMQTKIRVSDPYPDPHGSALI